MRRKKKKRKTEESKKKEEEEIERCRRKTFLGRQVCALLQV